MCSISFDSTATHHSLLTAYGQCKQMPLLLIQDSKGQHSSNPGILRSLTNSSLHSLLNVHQVLHKQLGYWWVTRDASIPLSLFFQFWSCFRDKIAKLPYFFGLQRLLHVESVVHRAIWFRLGGTGTLPGSFVSTILWWRMTKSLWMSKISQRLFHLPDIS